MFAQFATVYVEIDVRCKKFKMCFAKNKLVARDEHGKNKSPQKNNKLKPILIALQRIA